ncbi:MAG: hypothetical protein ACN2B6_00195 [Rickettsiales bacterium]
MPIETVKVKHGGREKGFVIKNKCDLTDDDVLFDSAPKPKRQRKSKVTAEQVTEEPDKE